MMNLFQKLRPLALCLALALPARVAWAHFQTCQALTNFQIPVQFCGISSISNLCIGFCSYNVIPGGYSLCVSSRWAPCTGCTTAIVQLPYNYYENSGCFEKEPVGSPCCPQGLCGCNDDFVLNGGGYTTAVVCRTYNDCLHPIAASVKSKPTVTN